jgi:hypothetical protein
MGQLCWADSRTEKRGASQVTGLGRHYGIFQARPQ